MKNFKKVEFYLVVALALTIIFGYKENENRKMKAPTVAAVPAVKSGKWVSDKATCNIDVAKNCSKPNFALYEMTGSGLLLWKIP